MAESPLKIGFNVQFSEAIKAAQQRRVVLPEVYYGELQGLARQQAFSIAGLASLDQLTIVRDSLAAKLQNGQTFRQWQKDMLESETLDLPRHRLDNIFRTNIQSNYNRGRWERFTEGKAMRPYLMYDAINDSRVRPAHLAMDGIIRPVDDPFWKTHAPLNGYRCRCRLISLSEGQARARSGADTGLNKGVDAGKMEPDKGFDYNPGEDLLAGVNRGIESRKATAPVKLVEALDAKLANGHSALVSDSFKLPKSGRAKDAAKITLSEIDKIHSIDGLPVIPIKDSVSCKFQGQYSHYPHNNKPVDIKLSKVSVNPEMTIAHEIGHFIDNQVMPKTSGSFSSTSSVIMEEWRLAIENSSATNNLKQMIGKGAFDQKSVHYYLSKHEQWARSYAQWIGQKSGNITMMEQSKVITEKSYGPYSCSQWNDADFAPISAAIDAIFEKLGWLK